MSRDVLLIVGVVATTIIIMLSGMLEEKLRYTNYKRVSLIACAVSVIITWMIVLNFDWIYNVTRSW